MELITMSRAPLHSSVLLHISGDTGHPFIDRGFFMPSLRSGVREQQVNDSGQSSYIGYDAEY
jgi:hypothetical protein